MTDDLREALDDLNRKFGPERTWAGGIPCTHGRRTDECEWCSPTDELPDTDIRRALADLRDKVCVSCDAVYEARRAGERCECGGLLMIMAAEDERIGELPDTDIRPALAADLRRMGLM